MASREDAEDYSGHRSWGRLRAGFERSDAQRRRAAALRRTQAAVQAQLAEQQQEKCVWVHGAHSHPCLNGASQRWPLASSTFASYDNVSVGDDPPRRLQVASWIACRYAGELSYDHSLLMMPHVTFVQESKLTTPLSRGACTLTAERNWVISGSLGVHRELATVACGLQRVQILEVIQLQRSLATRFRWRELTVLAVNSHLSYCSQGLLAFQFALDELGPYLDSAVRQRHVVLWGLDANVCLGGVAPDEPMFLLQLQRRRFCALRPCVSVSHVQLIYLFLAGVGAVSDVVLVGTGDRGAWQTD